MILIESAKLIASHTSIAGAMLLFFTAGAVCAPIVLRLRVRALLIVPTWFAQKLASVLDTRPSRPKLALLIFTFNGTAILIYMMTGLVPILPAFIAFSTGLNLILSSLIGKDRFEPDTTSAPPRSAILCGLLTFMIELPCFWYSMAMAWTMSPKCLGLFLGADASSIRHRIIAYFVIVLPALAISAFAEAHAVLSTRN